MVRKTKIHILCTTFLLAAGGAGASTLPPVAALDSNATINFSAQDGLSVVGDLVAQYRTPTGGPVPYIFKTALTAGPATVTPDLTISTQAIQISAGTPPTEVCLPFIGCNTIPGIPAVNLPSFSVDLTPTIPLAGQSTIYDLTYVSPDLPLGAIFNFDFGTPLLGNALTFGDVVQDQFETGEASVNVSGGAGPFGATFTYDGVLQPGNDTILADYTLTGTGPGVLGAIESFALGILNDNTSVLLDLAYDLFLGTDPCATLGPLAGTCNTILAGLAPGDLIGGITLNSVLNFSADVSVSKSITPVPLPAAGLLLLGGLGAFGVAARRKRRKAA